MMESDFRRCRSCGDKLEEDSEDTCPDCVSEHRRKDLLSFRSELRQFYEKFSVIAAAMDFCPTVCSRISALLQLIHQVLTDLDDYFGPSDSCVS
jgi:hypothetical protein